MILRLLFIALFSVSCASVSKMSKEEDAKAKKFTTQSKKAGLYIYRNEVMGAAVSMHIYLDGSHIAKTGPTSYVYMQLKPGVYTLKGEAENDSQVQIDLKAGKNTFVWQEVKMGLLTPRNKLQVVSESEGKKDVLESERIQTTRMPASK